MAPAPEEPSAEARHGVTLRSGAESPLRQSGSAPRQTAHDWSSRPRNGPDEHVPHTPGDDLHTYEPRDLEDMTALDAVDAVTADIRDHRITLDDAGVFNVMRHIDLLCHLTARMAADAEYQLAPNIADLPPAEGLGRSTGHLGRAVAHYAQTLSPLVTAAQNTLPPTVGSLDDHRTRAHLDAAEQALAAARTALDTPRPPAASSALVPAPPHAPAVRRLA
ncbi:hypothetical protein [Streptomyces sp. 8L]|uniref:hypothetical protein n=1 Tax=Streptomyces sp. 8L TaxID=2877242 RepID=UPI001CD6E8AD|nr:hypothetical protein [Streptomyces sp. 8L]MCA1221305.1 hypothetical protein [Streptomyces sp. 8L]